MSQCQPSWSPPTVPRLASTRMKNDAWRCSYRIQVDARRHHGGSAGTRAGLRAGWPASPLEAERGRRQFILYAAQGNQKTTIRRVITQLQFCPDMPAFNQNLAPKPGISGGLSYCATTLVFFEADTCAGQEIIPAYCSVQEWNEINNYSTGRKA